MRAALKEAMGRLRAGNVPSHTLAAELLLMHVLGRDRTWLYAHPEEPVGAVDAERYFALVAKRIAGAPTQYLTGKQEFWGLEFEVEPGVLIPRPETEHLVEVALERMGPPNGEDTSPPGKGLRIADIGTGCGCVAVALACSLPGSVVFATDVSAQALGVAQRNAIRHGVAGRVHFAQCNLLDAFLHGAEDTSRESRLFHLIVSNPPYVGRNEAASLPREVSEHEPEQALFGGEQGHEIYEPLVRQAAALFAPHGVLVLELGHNALAPVQALLDSAHGWTRIGVTHDLAGIPRVIAAERL